MCINNWGSRYKYFSANLVGKDYIVGDIHGCFDMLRVELNKINFDSKVDRLFSVGDLVDRGDNSEESLLWLNEPFFHAVLGNHELMAMQYDFYPQYSESYINNGGQWFVELDEVNRKKYADKFKQLPTIIAVALRNGKEIGIVHAECIDTTWEDNVKAALSDPFCNGRITKDMVWNRGVICGRDVKPLPGISLVYHGHTPILEANTIGNRRYIDTGAVFNNKLTVEELK